MKINIINNNHTTYHIVHSVNSTEATLRVWSLAGG